MTRPSDIPDTIWEQACILTDQYRHVTDDAEFAARILMASGQGAGIAGMTHEQAKALAFIRSYQTEHKGVSPTYHEIGAAVGRSRSNTHYMLHRMADRGIVRLATRARSITIVGRA